MPGKPQLPNPKNNNAPVARPLPVPPVAVPVSQPSQPANITFSHHTFAPHGGAVSWAQRHLDVAQANRDNLVQMNTLQFLSAPAVVRESRQVSDITPASRDVMLDAINCTQNNVSYYTSGGPNRSALWALSHDIATGGFAPQHAPTLVGLPSGHLLSLDNRRIVASDAAGLESIPAQIYHPNAPISSAQAIRFPDPNNNNVLPTTWGQAATNRINNPKNDPPPPGQTHPSTGFSPKVVEVKGKATKLSSRPG